MMKKDESIAYSFLSNLSIGTVLHEPDGNIPPDFSINSSIGIEVRRLNQHYFNNNSAEGLEQFRIPLFKMLRNVFQSFDKEFNGKTYLVSVYFERPIKIKMKEIEGKIIIKLKWFLENNRNVPYHLEIDENIAFDIFNSRIIEGRLFRLGGGVDFNNGGWLVSLYQENIQHIINDKTNKINKYYQKYDTWWLLLVDKIGWGLDSEEINELKRSISDKNMFNKILITDNEGKKCLFEMDSKIA
jgi:hypothetical protein